MDVSIVMTALDEPYVNKTIDDILEKTDSRLKEIIVIDDVSKEHIQHPDAKVYRNSSRQGLIWGRNFGTKKAQSDVIISVDPHVKIVSENWLDPIINKLEENYKCIAFPKTYCLDPETWSEFNKDVPGFRTTWDWSLDFNWVKGKPKDGSSESPAVAGHCFSFTKKWWDESGGFDDKMMHWGGENIEFSLKTWLCGGSVEFVDCWVAHWFKKTFQYEINNETLLQNKSRVAEVWFGDFKKYFYKAVNRYPGSIDFGDIRDRIRTRVKKQERPFKWFLDRFKDSMPLIN